MGRLKITLQRAVSLEAVEVLAFVGISEARPEMRALLLLAKETGGTVTPSDVVSQLLPGRPIVLGKRILARAKELGLLDASGTLTSRGELALERGEVFIPEQGRFRLVGSEDPLLQTDILGCRREEEWGAQKVLAERKKQREAGGSRAPEKGRALPNWLRGASGSPHPLAWKSPGGGSVVEIRSIEPQCVHAQLGKEERLIVTWTLPQQGRQTVQLNSRVNAVQKPPSLEWEEAFHAILGIRVSDWDSRQQSLAVTFAELPETDRLRFSMTLQAGEPTIPGFGRFDATQIEGVPVHPRSKEDAMAWALWLLEQRIDRYMNQARYLALCKDVEGLFPGYHLRLPHPGKLAAQIRSRTASGEVPLPASYWYLQTPVDLPMPEVHS